MIFDIVRNTLFKEKIMLGAGVMGLGIFIGSTFNYLTQVFLGRMLSVEDYGTYNSLLSLMVIIAIPISALVSSLIKTVAGLRIKNDYKTLTNIFWKTSGFIAIFALILNIIIFIFRNDIFSYLNISNVNLVIPFMLYSFFILLSSVPKSFLQGLLRYKAVGLYAVMSPVVRLIASVLLIILGYKVMGAFFGAVLAVTFSYFLTLYLIRKNLSPGGSADLKKYYKNIITFGVTFLIIRASLTAMSNIDIVLVKHFFSPKDAGIYAGIVTIGKIILFGTGILGTVMFPIISNLYASKSDYYKKFFLFFAIQLIVVLGGVLAFSIFPEFITVNMFGNGYRPAIEYLAKFSIFVGLFSMVNFIYLFLLAIEKTKSYSILFFGFLVQVILIYFYHGSLSQVININIAVMSGIFLSSLFYLKRTAS